MGCEHEQLWPPGDAQTPELELPGAGLPPPTRPPPQTSPPPLPSPPTPPPSQQREVQRPSKTPPPCVIQNSPSRHSQKMSEEESSEARLVVYVIGVLTNC
ncbi:unnamed protein product [Angiostrongylus costaricensis]|uniref:Rhoa gtpase effector dia/diaphanous n=1 Tax=Angiostrongylus costaricensis TaxID=334426 RepID=A0A0R3PDL5_ANGCS|nr:unnamed protein product [Angiostrongylus costaricensis]